nr:DarT ssDNA thymidine ADP-ribosyltransferase family protein [Mycolicibacterium fluoranthenivorans]
MQLKRVAHFTPSKNLFHIIQDGQIRSSKDLADRASEYFAPTDLERFDRHPDKTCVSFTYPNGYYLSRARKKPQYSRFPDWVCLLIQVRVLERSGVLFSPCNAATGRGAYAKEGPAALQACFSSSTPSGFTRGQRHHPRAATDLQAEALIPGPIPLSDLIAIVAPSADAAGNEYARLAIGGLNPDGLDWLIAPVMFDRDGLSASLRYGSPAVTEEPWSPQAVES